MKRPKRHNRMRRNPNNWITQLARGQITPAGLERLLQKARTELEDAVYFKYPKKEIDALQKEIAEMEEALGQADQPFQEYAATVPQAYTSLDWDTYSRIMQEAEGSEGMLSVAEEYYPQELRPRKAVEAMKKYASGKISKEQLDEAGKEVWNVARIISRAGNDEVASIAAAIGKMIDDIVSGVLGETVKPQEQVVQEIDMQARQARMAELEKAIAGIRFDIQDARRFREPTVDLERQLEILLTELNTLRG